MKEKSRIIDPRPLNPIKAKIISKSGTSAVIRFYIFNILGWVPATRFVRSDKRTERIIKDKIIGKELHLGGNLKKHIYMGRKYNVLIVVSFLTSIISLQNCEEKQFIGDLPTVKVEFKDAVGKYVFVPIIDVDINDFKTFGLKNGDTLKFEIKSDSTFTFNHFYYDRLERIDDYRGKLVKSYGTNKFEIPFPKQAEFSNQGFLKAKDGLYFFTRLRMDGFENYEYHLFYKKVE